MNQTWSTYFILEHSNSVFYRDSRPESIHLIHLIFINLMDLLKDRKEAFNLEKGGTSISCGVRISN
jgi:hypothetical protein